MGIQKNAAPAAKEAKPAKAKAEAPKKQAAADTAPETTAKVTRRDLASAIRDKVIAAGAAISPKVAEIAAVAYEEAVVEALASGAEVTLPGFGKFVSVHKDEAEKRNPATGEMVTVAAHNVPRFKAGSKFKEALNGGTTVGDE
jgi:DNA-binding protein HU-beta